VVTDAIRAELDGRAVLHRCGPQAQASWQASFLGGDRVSLLARPQCRLAGLGPAADPADGAS